MTVKLVRAGTAEQLARLRHFRDLEDTQPEELDYVALFLMGPGGEPAAKWELWEELHEDCEHLFHLITDDWDDRDLDDLDEAQCARLPLTASDAQVDELRHEVTRDRLIAEIERRIYLLLNADTIAPPTVGDAVVQDLLGSR